MTSTPMSSASVVGLPDVEDLPRARAQQPDVTLSRRDEQGGGRDRNRISAGVDYPAGDATSN